MNKIKHFFADFFATVSYFALAPLQWLFWHMPRVYEAIICIIIFFKNNWPSATEWKHTMHHHLQNTIKVLTLGILQLIGVSLYFAIKLQRWQLKLIEQSDQTTRR